MRRFGSLLFAPFNFQSSEGAHMFQGSWLSRPVVVKASVFALSAWVIVEFADLRKPSRRAGRARGRQQGLRPLCSSLR